MNNGFMVVGGQTTGFVDFPVWNVYNLQTKKTREMIDVDWCIDWWHTIGPGLGASLFCFFLLAVMVKL